MTLRHALRHAMRRCLPPLLALAGLALLLLNLWGLASPNDQRGAFPQDRIAPYPETLHALDALEAEAPGLQAGEVVRRANELVHLAMKPVWPRELARVPARQNWILWAMAFADPLLHALGLTDSTDLFRVYQMTCPDPALRRGFGICSQQALVLSGILEERFAIASDIVGLDGHVVTQVRLPDGSLLLADPHKGVVLPFGIEHAENHLDEVAALYPPGTSAARRYDADGNVVVPGGVRGYNPKLYVLERASSVLVWVVPVLLLLPWLVSRLGSRLRRRS